MQTFSINGEICSAAEATIPVCDHGLLYGDGVFEGLRFYNKRVLMMSDHLKRLKDSADAINLILPYELDEIKRFVNELVSASADLNGYIRLVVTRGVGPLGIDPSHCEAGNLIIIADQLTLVGERVRAAGAKLIVASTRRLGADQIDGRIKSLNYLNQIMARLEANDAGADEAIVLNHRGFVAEGTADNLFICKDGILSTPPITDGALAGITRKLVLETSKNLSLEVSERSLTVYDLYTADECFLTGTGAELIPVGRISGRNIKQCPGDLFAKIDHRFQQALTEDDWFH